MVQQLLDPRPVADVNAAGSGERAQSETEPFSPPAATSKALGRPRRPPGRCRSLRPPNSGSPVANFDKLEYALLSKSNRVSPGLAGHLLRRRMGVARHPPSPGSAPRTPLSGAVRLSQKAHGGRRNCAPAFLLDCRPPRLRGLSSAQVDALATGDVRRAPISQPVVTFIAHEFGEGGNPEEGGHPDPTARCSSSVGLAGEIARPRSLHIRQVVGEHAPECVLPETRRLPYRASKTSGSAPEPVKVLVW